MKPTLRLLVCRRCSTPVVETLDPIRVRCDIGALSPADEARAWLAERRTYSVRSLAREQYLVRRFCTRESARATVAHIATDTQPELTILAAHACPGAGPRSTELHDWRGEDRRAFFPSPRTPGLHEEPAF